jgi:hypothetical protein
MVRIHLPPAESLRTSSPASGAQAAREQALLRWRGYRVRRLEDGFLDWKMAGLPIRQISGPLKQYLRELVTRFEGLAREIQTESGFS